VSKQQVLLFVALFIGLGFLFGYSGQQALRVSTDERDVQDRFPWREGPQLVATYYGSASCGWCTDERMPNLLDEAMQDLAVYAEDNELTLVTVGVAVDSSIDEGLQHLEEVGDFDQVATGGSWANELTVGLLDAGLPSVTGVPQVVVHVRYLDVVGGGSGGAVRRALQRSALSNKQGFWDIQSWVLRGTPLPSLDSGFKERRAERGFASR